MNEASNLGMVRGVFVVVFFFLNFQWTKWKTTFDNKSSFLRVSLIPFLWVQGCNAILLAKKQQRKKKQHRRPTRNKKWNKQTRMVFSKKFFFFFFLLHISSLTTWASLQGAVRGQPSASPPKHSREGCGRAVLGDRTGTPGHETYTGAMADRAALRKRAENPNLREDNACTQPNESKRHHTQPSHT